MEVDTASLQKLHNSLNHLGHSEVQSLYNVNDVFRHTSAAFSIEAEKVIIYGNIYDSFKKTISSFLNITEDKACSQINPLYFNEITWGSHKFQLSSQIKLDIDFFDDMWEAENTDLDIYVVADDIEELESNFQEEFFVMWQVYSQEPDANLTAKARQIKKTLRDLITGVIVDCN